MPRKTVALAIVALLILGAALYGIWHFRATRAASQTASASAPYVIPPLGEKYTNEQFRFSLTMPEGFSAREIPDEENEGGETAITLQDPEGNGIQIFITPFPEDLRVLSADDVRASIPDMRITDEQPVEIGESHTGVAFKSDNEAFGGASREVWFVWQGNLYQISTYERLDKLLQSMFATWQFF